MPSSKLIHTVLFAAALLSASTSAFTTQRSIINGMESMHQEPSTAMFLSNNSNNNDSEDRLRQLGYSDDEIRRSNKVPEREEMKVRVDLVDDVDPVSLTAIGFALIAVNFLVFANMGDGGISGIVARLINSF